MLCDKIDTFLGGTLLLEQKSACLSARFVTSQCPCMRATFLFSVFGVALALTGCVVTYVTPIAVSDTKRMDTTPDQASLSVFKTFYLPNDWQYGPWIMKRGSKITYFENGMGRFSGSVYTQYSTVTDHLHLQALAYGKDGNLLFGFPGNDTGFPMRLATSYRDYPYTADFAFDPRYFHDIDTVKFYARHRLRSQHVGERRSKRASYISRSRGDTARQPPRILPPQP